MAARRLDVVNQSIFWLGELRKNQTDTEAAIEASTALRHIGSVDRAVEVAAIGLQANDNSPQLWAALALALVARGENEPAVQALQKAITLDPRNPALHTSLGIAYDRLESGELAAVAYEQALRLAPNDVGILTNYGLSKALNGKLPEAEAMLRRAAQDPLAPPQTRQNLAMVVGLQGRFEESQRLATRDLPPEIAAANVEYLRRMLTNGTTDTRWNQARSDTSGR